MQLLKDTPPVLLHIAMVLPCPRIIMLSILFISTTVGSETVLDVM